MMNRNGYDGRRRGVKAWYFCLLLCLSSFVLKTQEAWALDGTATLIFVSHIQSQLLPITAKVNKTTVSFGGLAHAAGVAELEKKQNPNAIFFQTGEAVEGPLWRNFGGKPEFEALNAAGVQVGMFGKHEFDYGFEHMKKGLSYATFPFVVSNVEISDPELREKVKRNIVLPAGKMKVGFFSLLSPWIFSTTKKVDEVQVLPHLFETAKEMVQELKDQGADVIVMMSNLSEMENTEIAKEVRGIHAVVGRGIFYKETTEAVYVEGADGWQTLMVLGDAFGKVVGKCVVAVKGGMLDKENCVWKLLPVTSRSPINAAVMRIATEYEELLNLAMDKTIGYFETPIDARSVLLRRREAPLGNFAADAIRWKLKTDVGLMNGGGLRGNLIYPAGEVSEKTISKLLPHGNTLDIVTLTGKQLRDVMELSASALQADDKRDGYDPTYRTPEGGFMQVSGLRVTYSLSGQPVLFDEAENVKEWGNRVKALSVLKNGEWQDVKDDETYTVGINAWTASGGDRYFVFKDAPKVHTDYKDAGVFADYLLTFPEGRIKPSLDGRITVED